ncbi:translocation protein TolB [Gaopeijia maritima]|uniref:Translocation protein TolB n=1 Tax=Gaopeijia maritima TaxID=3119007 RepID=A0ABU9E6V9_9BACT
MRRAIGVAMALSWGVAACGGGDSTDSAEDAAGVSLHSGQVAFVSDREGNFDIFLLDRASDSVTNLTDHPAMDYGFSWSPDGASMAFASDRDGNREIYRLDLATGAIARLTDHEARDGAPGWSPDGGRIAFISQRDSDSGEIYVMDADGTNLQRLTDNARYEEVPSWSPDGSTLAFGALASAREGADETLQIFTIDVATGVESQITFLDGHNSAPRWAPDGGRIYFYGQVGEDFAGADILSIAPDGSGLTNLTNDADPDWQPDPGPDGDYLVYARGPGDPLDLWIMRSDGSDPQPLLTYPGRDEQPQWRPR